jgi:hypothetical protein
VTTPYTVRPTLIGWTFFGAWVLHEVALLIWFNLDHETATSWLNTLGFIVFSHCFDEGGFFSHMREVESAGLTSGWVLGAIGLPFAAVGLVRSRDARSVALALAATFLNLSIITPLTVALWDLHQRQAAVMEARPRGLVHRLAHRP